MQQREAVRMTAAEVDDFLRARRVMNVATIGADHRPHLVAMWYGWSPDGLLAFATYRRSQKIRNLQRSPVLTALVEDGEQYAELRGVQLVCDVTLTDDSHVVNAIGESLYNRYHAEREGPLTDELRPLVHAGMAKRTAVLLDVIDTTTWDHSKLRSGA
jgi:PPOX class probable F420-dependent enzyme